MAIMPHLAILNGYAVQARLGLMLIIINSYLARLGIIIIIIDSLQARPATLNIIKSF